jgi:CYTH domain-containing protein
MAIEIERRFLVRDPQAAIADSTIANRFQIRQGYLGWVYGLRLPVRLIGDDRSQRSAVLTLKGRRQGICRKNTSTPWSSIAPSKPSAPCHPLASFAKRGIESAIEMA